MQGRARGAREAWVALWIIMTIVAEALVLQRIASAQPPVMEKSREPKVNTALLEKKLDEVLTKQATILKNQQTIFQRFDAVMEELRIIKVRATR